MSIYDNPPSEDSGARLTPPIRVIRGHATPEELAAVVCVVLAHRRARTAVTDPAGSHPVRSRWARTGLPSGFPTTPGHDAWRHSGLPR